MYSFWAVEEAISSWLYADGCYNASNINI